MKPKTTLILFIVLIAAGVFYWLWGVRGQEQRDQRAEMAQRIIPVEEDDVNKVALFHRGDSALVYERRGDEWRITFPVTTGANQNQISTHLSALLEAEKTRTLTENPGANLAQYNLEPPEYATHIFYSDTGKAELLIGGENPTGSGVYAKLHNAPAVYLSNTNIRTQAEKELFDLRDKSIAMFDRNAVQKIVIERVNDRDLVFEKADNIWRLTEPAIRVNQSEVTSILSTIQNGTAQEYLEEMAVNLGDYGLQNPQITVSFFTDDTTRTAALILGQPVDDSDNPQYYAKDMTRPMVFSVNNNVYSNVAQDLFEFQDKDLFDVSQNQISDVIIEWNDETYEVSQVDTAWQIIRPVRQPADEDKISEIRRQLANLRMDEPGSYTQTDPAAYGLDNPWLRVEFKVGGSDFDGFTIGDTGDEDMRYIKTDSSPYIYQIATSKLEEFQVSLENLAAETKEETAASE